MPHVVVDPEVWAGYFDVGQEPDERKFGVLFFLLVYESVLERHFYDPGIYFLVGADLDIVRVVVRVDRDIVEFEPEFIGNLVRSRVNEEELFIQTVDCQNWLRFQIQIVFFII